MHRLGRIAQTVEFTVAGLITAAILTLHLNVMQHAGPLWRDEISSLRVATMPTLGGLWASLVFDPVPGLFFGALRFWDRACGGASDNDLRILGFIVGVAITAALWITSWMLKKSPPTWALLLFGLSPVALVWGDSMRAYGFGCLFNILTLGCIWKLLCERPRPVHIVAAASTALLSVHSLFPNSLLLFAAIASAVVVALRRGWFRTGLILIGVGVAAAVSLLPYAGIIQATQRWSPLAKGGINSMWIFTMLFHALQSGGQLSAILWMGGTGLAAVALFVALIRPRLAHLNEADTNLITYSGLTLLIAVTLTVCFFRWVGWATSLWYYLPVMATAVVCIDSGTKILRQNVVASLANSMLLLFAAMSLCPLALQATSVRLTNVDLISAAIAQCAEREDLVVVDNYFYGVSFHHYYHGQASLISVPDVSDSTLHRWDLLTDTMRRSKPIQPVLDRIEQTLKAGHDVYVVGFALTNHGAVQPPDLAPAPAGTTDWSLWPYVRRWTQQVAYEVQTHALHGKVISVPCEQPVSVAEEVHAIVVSGWKETQVAAAP
jgi:hypothetical protein